MIKKILLETLNSLYVKRWVIFKTLLPYLIILLGIEGLMSFLVIRMPEPATNTVKSYLIYFYVALFIKLFISFLIAVKTHRVLLLKEDEIKNSEFYHIGFKEFKFLFASIKLTLIVAFVCFIFAFFFKIFQIHMAVGIVLGVAISSFIVSRLSLVLPSISIEKDMSFRHSWEYTKEYKFIIFFIIVLYPVIISLVLGMTYALVIKFISELLGVDLTVLMVLLNVCITVLIIGGLSVLYQVIIDEKNDLSYDVVQAETKQEV